MKQANLWNLLVPISMAISIDPNCDYYQELVVGQQYYIHSINYPSYYPASTSCRWIAESPAGTVIKLSCEKIDLPSSKDCKGDRLFVSLTRNGNFKDARIYCGKGSLAGLATDTNALAVGLFATSSSAGGKFVCVLRASTIQNNAHLLTTTNNKNGSTTEKPKECNCGRTQQTRIVGGQDTEVNEFPAMAGLVNILNRNVFCGATIITDRYAVTAAHCFGHNMSITEFMLLVGDHNIHLGNDTAAAKLYIVSQLTIHENYNSSTFACDIAIVKTTNMITFNDYVGPICLPIRHFYRNFASETVTALGWGLLEHSGMEPIVLQKVNLTVITNSDCARQVIHNSVTSNEICTYSPPRDTCSGDSGGPLLWFDAQTRRWQLVGIVSNGVGCAAGPGVSIRVMAFVPWIFSHTSNDYAYCFM